MFDQQYRQLPGLQPAKFEVGYLDEFRRELQPEYDQCERDIKGSAYAVAVDVNGYAAIHNARFSKPLTGDARIDLAGNRTMRKFDNPGELRAARNIEPCYFRTYCRDTGEIVTEMAMPIHVSGRL